MFDYSIFKGNLSEDLKADIIETLVAMLNSEDAAEKQFAVTTLLTYKRDLSAWPANDWTNSPD